MKPTCAYYRDWKDAPHWCITNWCTCEAMGDECRDFTPATTPDMIRKTDPREDDGNE